MVRPASGGGLGRDLAAHAFHSDRGVPAIAEVTEYGSAADPATLDGWSDLDLRLRLGRDLDAAELVPSARIRRTRPGRGPP